jgi:hypothetical protein
MATSKTILDTANDAGAGHNAKKLPVMVVAMAAA